MCETPPSPDLGGPPEITFDYRFKYDLALNAFLACTPIWLFLVFWFRGSHQLDPSVVSIYSVASLAIVGSAYYNWKKRTNEQIMVKGKLLTWTNWRGQSQMIDLTSTSVSFRERRSGQGGPTNSRHYWYEVRSDSGFARFDYSIKQPERLIGYISAFTPLEKEWEVRAKRATEAALARTEPRPPNSSLN